MEKLPDCAFCGSSMLLELEVWGEDWMPLWCCEALQGAFLCVLEGEDEAGAKELLAWTRDRLMGVSES